MPTLTTILVDTNLLVYAYDPRDEAKNDRAQQVLQRLRRSRRGVISVQSLAEFMRVSQKLAMSPDDALRIVQAFAVSWPVLDLTPAIVLEAGRGVRQYALAYYDAQIWAAARLNQISVIFSEDFNPSSILDGVRFVNPFAEEFVMEAWT